MKSIRNCWWKEVGWERDQIIKNHKNKDYINNISNTLIWRYDMALKIAYGIRNLHSLGIEHYHIKPQNIFMMNSFTHIIGDFGLLSKPFIERMDSTAGTRYYLAPEAQYRFYNDKTDIYAILFCNCLKEVAKEIVEKNKIAVADYKERIKLKMAQRLSIN